MDYQEAIEYFEKELRYKKMVLSPLLEGKETVNEQYIKIAISAMKELQALHDQGMSLERLRDIDFRKEVVERINYDSYMSLMDELEEYKQIGTLEEVREAVEKQDAKKPNYEGDGYAPDGTFVYDEWECPNCGKKFEVDYDDYDYCPKCGQAIDWSEEE